MTLRNMSLLSAATVAASGGSALPFLPSSGASDDKLVMYATADTDLRTRRTIEFTAKLQKVSASAPNGYTQPRCTVYLRFPQTLANGITTVDTLKIELARDVETTQAEVLEYLKVGSQCLTDADVLEFFYNLSLN